MEPVYIMENEYNYQADTGVWIFHNKKRISGYVH